MSHNSPLASGVSIRLIILQLQSTQIREIFNLFDTDGGGTIDRKVRVFPVDMGNE